ncbi:hypothetical protein ACOSP7_031757 [Xanthoceras sorbifolium]
MAGLRSSSYGNNNTDSSVINQQTSSASLTLSSASTNFVQSGNGRGQQSYNRERRGRGRGNGRGRGTMCQLCGRVGHYSAIYYHRFDQNFQGNRPNPTQTEGYQGQGRGTNAGNTIQGQFQNTFPSNNLP